MYIFSYIIYILANFCESNSELRMLWLATIAQKAQTGEKQKSPAKYNIRAITTIEADVWLSEEEKIPEFGSVNLDPAGSALVFSILQVLRFSGSLSLGLSIQSYNIFYFLNKQYIIDHHTCTTAKCICNNFIGFPLKIVIFQLLSSVIWSD